MSPDFQRGGNPARSIPAAMKIKTFLEASSLADFDRA
jgi:hypothetical protein